MFYQFYFDPQTKFDDLVFYEMNALESFSSKNLPMSWCAILNGEEPNCLVIEFVGFKCVVNQLCFTIGFLKHVLRPYFPLVMVHVKSNCGNFAKALVDEIKGRFLNHELMSALGVIYRKFWAPNLDNVIGDFH